MRLCSPITNFIWSACVIIIAGALSSCEGNKEGKKTIYSCYQDIPQSGWAQEDVIEFHPFPMDSIVDSHTTYILEISMRWSARKGLPDKFPLEVTFPDAESGERCDTVLMDLNGKGNSLSITYGVGAVTATLVGNYDPRPEKSVSLRPLLDPAKSQGLLNVGLILIKNSDK